MFLIDFTFPAKVGFLTSRTHFWSSFWELWGAFGDHFCDFGWFDREVEKGLNLDGFRVPLWWPGQVLGRSGQVSGRAVQNVVKPL